MGTRRRFRFGLRAFYASAYTFAVLAASVATYLDEQSDIPLFLLIDLPLVAFLPVPDLPSWGRLGDVAMPTLAGLLQACVLWAIALIPVRDSPTSSPRRDT